MSRRLALVLVVALTGGACGSAPRAPLGIKEVPRDVVYGDRTKPTVPPPPLGANPAPAFPGFLLPPVVEAVQPPTRPAPAAACPEDDPLATPAEATPTIGGQPLPGGYPFRQQAKQVLGNQTTVLPYSSVHRVDNLAPGPGGVVGFDVGIAEAGVTTTTTFQIRRSGVEDGLYIAQIRSDGSGGTSAFTPSAAVKMLPTPTVRGMRWSSVGTDPLGGITMVINGYVTGKTRVNACGTPVDAWQVEVGTDPQTGQPSRIVKPSGDVTITGTYAVATHLGGLIVAEDLTLDGRESGQPLTLTRSDRINKVTPDA